MGEFTAFPLSPASIFQCLHFYPTRPRFHVGKNKLGKGVLVSRCIPNGLISLVEKPCLGKNREIRIQRCSCDDHALIAG